MSTYSGEAVDVFTYFAMVPTYNAAQVATSVQVQFNWQRRLINTGDSSDIVLLPVKSFVFDILDPTYSNQKVTTFGTTGVFTYLQIANAIGNIGTGQRAAIG